jgi:hypothetical protein
MTDEEIAAIADKLRENPKPVSGEEFSILAARAARHAETDQTQRMLMMILGTVGIAAMAAEHGDAALLTIIAGLISPVGTALKANARKVGFGAGSDGLARVFETLDREEKEQAERN